MGLVGIAEDGDLDGFVTPCLICGKGLVQVIITGDKYKYSCDNPDCGLHKEEENGQKTS